MSATSILINIGAKTGGATNEIDKVNKSLGGMEKSSARAKKAFLAGAVAIAAGAAVATAGAVKAINAASDQQQAFGALDSVFKKQAESVKKWADQQARWGLSATDAANSAALLGAQLKNAGYNASEAAKRSQKLVGLGADLAATYGGTTADAVDAVSAAFKGEFDSLEKYGVSLKAADVTARLAAKGQDKLTGAALKQAQAAAIQELLWRQTKDAQGQAAREADSFAGVMAALSAYTENAAAALGELLLPIASKVVGVIGRLVKSFTAAVEAFKKGKSAGGIAKALGLTSEQGAIIKTVLGVIKDGFATAKEVIGQVVTEAKKWLSVFTAIGSTLMNGVIVVFNTLRDIFFAVKPVIEDVGRVLYDAFEAARPTVEKIVLALQDLFTYVADVLGPAISKFAQRIADDLGPVIESVGTFIRERAIPAFKKFADIFTEKVVPAGKKVADAIKKIIEDVQPVVDFILQKVIPTLVDKLSPAFTAVSDAVTAIVDVVTSIVGAFASWVSSSETATTVFQVIAGVLAALAAAFILVNVAVGIWSVVGAIATAVTTAFGAAVAFATSPLTLIIVAIIAVITVIVLLYKNWDKITAFLSNVWAKIKDTAARIWGSIKQFFADLWTAIKTKLSEAWNGIKTALSNAWTRIVDAVKTKTSALVTFVKGIPKKLLNAIGNLGSKLFQKGKDLIQGLIDGIKSMAGRILDAILGLLPGPVRGIVRRAVGLAAPIGAGRTAVTPLGASTRAATSTATINVNSSGLGVVDSPRALINLLETHQTRMGRKPGTPRRLAW
jgi:phage-related protein